MTKRVGSMRPDGSRDSLPMGPEAIRRAARLRRSWGQADTRVASVVAFSARYADGDATQSNDEAGWLPVELRR